eukprot:973983-Pelagomonas_calceolata.AAC.2
MKAYNQQSWWLYFARWMTPTPKVPFAGATAYHLPNASPEAWLVASEAKLNGLTMLNGGPPLKIGMAARPGSVNAALQSSESSSPGEVPDVSSDCMIVLLIVGGMTMIVSAAGELLKASSDCYKGTAGTVRRTWYWSVGKLTYLRCFVPEVCRHLAAYQEIKQTACPMCCVQAGKLPLQ